mmetsp:Transcript_5060/g.8114  ORF Transcript_5060/g.8114 Transcript_5060/m.8114 type:complete len:107 (+) Transcript_5060:231-551(+)
MSCQCHSRLHKTQTHSAMSMESVKGWIECARVTCAYGYLRTHTEFFSHAHTEFHSYTCACLFVSARVHVCVWARVCIFVCGRARACVCVGKRVCVFVPTHVYKRAG